MRASSEAQVQQRAAVRSERAQRAAELQTAGLKPKAIATEMGISKTYAYDLLNDPSGDRAKVTKARYAGTCSDCGGPTSAHNSHNGATGLCKGCLNAPMVLGLKLRKTPVRGCCSPGCDGVPLTGRRSCATHAELYDEIAASLGLGGWRGRSKQRRGLHAAAA